MTSTLLISNLIHNPFQCINLLYFTTRKVLIISGIASIIVAVTTCLDIVYRSRRSSKEAETQTGEVETPTGPGAGLGGAETTVLSPEQLRQKRLDRLLLQSESGIDVGEEEEEGAGDN